MVVSLAIAASLWTGQYGLNSVRVPRDFAPISRVEMAANPGLANAIARAPAYRSIPRQRPEGDRGAPLPVRDAAFASKVDIRSVSAKVSETRRVRTGVRGVIVSSPHPRRIRSGNRLVVLRGREVFAEFPETYRVRVRLLAPFEPETVSVRVTLSGGGQYFLEQPVTFGAIASKTLTFDFAASEVTAPNRVTVNVLGGAQATFAVDLPRWGEEID